MVQSLYYAFVWEIPVRNQVLVFYPKGSECVWNNKISVMLKISDKTVVIPRASHMIFVHLASLANVFPLNAEVYLKTSINQRSSVACVNSIHQHLMHLHEPVSRLKKVDLPFVMPTHYLQHILQHGIRKHYFLTSPVPKMTWNEVNKFCADTLNATAFVYLSQEELMDIAHFLTRKSQIIITGFEKDGKVKLCIGFFICHYQYKTILII